MFTAVINTTCPAPTSVLNAVSGLGKLLARIQEASAFKKIQNCEVYLPSLGTFISAEPFYLRDYKEGQLHRGKLFLFAKGILVAKQKGLRKFKKNSDLEYDSFFELSDITLDLECFRLQDHKSKLTCYKVTEKRREFLRWEYPKAMAEFLVEIRKLKAKTTNEQTLQGINELASDLDNQEAINWDVILGKGNETEVLNFLPSNETIQTRCMRNGEELVEAVNITLCYQVMWKRRFKSN